MLKYSILELIREGTDFNFAFDTVSIQNVELILGRWVDVIDEKGFVGKKKLKPLFNRIKCLSWLRKINKGGDRLNVITKVTDFALQGTVPRSS
jgi:hypothetical protein